METKPRIIVFDIENYNLDADYGILLCVGWKVLGEKAIQCPALWEFGKWNKGDIFNDEALVRAIHPVLRSADALVAHFGCYHDVTFMNSKFVQLGLAPISDIPLIDTWRLSRKNLKLSNNRLGNIAEFLGAKPKMKVEKSLWKDVLNRKPKAFKKMIAYCKQDVKTLEEVFIKLRAFATNVPNYNLWGRKGNEDPGHRCPNCGSRKIKSEGWRYTKTAVYRRMICKDCRTWSQFNKNETQIKR